jgi:signal transduction histidine kinase
LGYHPISANAGEDQLRVGGNPREEASLISQPQVRTQSIFDEVMDAFQRRLACEDSALLRDAGTFTWLTDQVRFIFSDVLGALDEPGSMAPLRLAHPAEADSDRLLSVELGISRASSGIHPAESLRAADELFDVALPVIVRRKGLTGLEILDLSQQLHQAITNRIALASLPYIEFLLTRVHSTGKTERQRISRDLHDRVGHGMALALQHFDLHRYFSKTRDERAEHEFTVGMEALDEALRLVRQLSTELRRSVGEDGIRAAIESYLRDNAAGGVRTALTITGDAMILAPPIAEELYLIIREACHNALIHGEPGDLRISLAVTGTTVTADVADDGRGFRVGIPANSAGVGLRSMAERVELINGSLRVDSKPGQGTTVTVRVPLFASGKL